MTAKKGGKSLKDDLNRETPKYPNQKIKLTLDIPPSQNHMYFTAKNGMRILKKDAQEYFRKIEHKAKKEVEKQKWKKDKGSVWYYADLYYYFPDKRKRDTHNTLKILLDGLEGIIYPNDYYVLPRIQNAQLDRKNPRVYIEIYPILIK